MDMGLSQLGEIVKDREARRAGIHEVAKSLTLMRTEQLNNHIRISYSSLHL